MHATFSVVSSGSDVLAATHADDLRVGDVTVNRALSLALHQAVAGKLRSEPALLEIAKQQLEKYSQSGQMHTYYADGWASLLAGPLDDLLAFLADSGQRAADFRSCSPFAGLLTSAERWGIWYQFRGKAATQGQGDEPRGT